MNENKKVRRIARVTSKIVTLTGNTNTKKFVGQKIVPKNAKNGTRVYAIGKTGYVLSKDEFMLFVKAGAIEIVTLKKGEKLEDKLKSNASESDSDNDEDADTHSAIDKDIIDDDINDDDEDEDNIKDIDLLAENQVAYLAIDAKAEDLEEQNDIVKSAFQGGEIDLAAHEELLENSEFLLNYPEPSFDLDLPAHLKIFGGNNHSKKSGFFDKMGKKGRDKIVNSLKADD